MAGNVLELEDMRSNRAIKTLDIDGEGLRLAVVSEGELRLYVGVGLRDGVTQEVFRYKRGAAVKAARWSPSPVFTDEQTILGEYVLAVGKKDGSMLILSLTHSEEGRREDWKCLSKAKEHTASVSSLVWTQFGLVSASADHCIVLYAFDSAAKSTSLSGLHVIASGMECILGIGLCEKYIFAQELTGLIRVWTNDKRGKKVLEVSFRPASSPLPFGHPCICDHWMCFPAIPSTNSNANFSILLINTVNFNLREIPYLSLYPTLPLNVKVAGTSQGLVIISREGVKLLDLMTLRGTVDVGDVGSVEGEINAVLSWNTAWMLVLGTKTGFVYRLNLVF